MLAPERSFDGTSVRIAVHHWDNPSPRYVALIAHGYGEHAGRYEHVAAALVADGAVVDAPDHVGHGASGGERASVGSIEEMVDDLHALAGVAHAAHPDLPVVLIGHSMGGIVATRYAQRFGNELAALVLSGPAIGGNPGILMLAEMDPIPEIPIDPEVLSRDPAVGEAYDADPLVYHGPFRRETLQAFIAAVAAIAAGPSFGDLPTLWIHGEEDALAPLDATREAIDHLRGSRLDEKVYPGARHEIFNETNQAEVIGDVIAFLHSAL